MAPYATCVSHWCFELKSEKKVGATLEYQTSEGLLAARLLQQLSVPKPVQSPQDLFTSIDLNTLYPNILNMSNLYWCGSMNYLLMVKHTHINSDWDKIYLLFLVGVGVPCELNP